jgi:hypothetical protein
MLPSTIAHVAAQHAIPSSIVPQYAGDRQQVSRAISQVSSHLSRQGWVLTSITMARHEVVYGISAVQKDQQRERVDHTFDDRLRWSDEGGNGAHVEGQHPIALAVDQAYQALRGHICPGDWTEALSQYLIGICQAFAFREDGRVYWVPPAGVPKMAALQQFLSAVGIALVVCEVEAQAKASVQHAAGESLADQLASLQAAVVAFDGKQKPSNYARRIEEIETLRKRATTYREVLGLGVSEAQAILDHLDQTTRGMLDLRLETVVHRKSETAAVAGSAAPGLGSRMLPDQAWQQESFAW